MRHEVNRAEESGPRRLRRKLSSAGSFVCRGSPQAARLEEIQRLLICLILHRSYHDFVYLEISVISSLQMNVNTFGQLQEYEPPKWASSLKNIPRNFVKVRQNLNP